MKIKSVKPGDILTVKRESKNKDKDIFFDNKWKVIKVYRNHVLARSMKVPQIRRCFCYGELIMMKAEMQNLIFRGDN